MLFAKEKCVVKESKLNYQFQSYLMIIHVQPITKPEKIYGRLKYCCSWYLSRLK